MALSRLPRDTEAEIDVSKIVEGSLVLKQGETKIGDARYTTSEGVVLEPEDDDTVKLKTGDTDNAQAVLEFRMKARGNLKIDDLPLDSKYQVMEAASDHLPSYALSSDEWTADSAKAQQQTAKASDSASSGKSLATSTETVEEGDGTITITYTNHRDEAPQTGIVDDIHPWVVMLFMIIILLAYDDQMRRVKSRAKLGRPGDL